MAEPEQPQQRPADQRARAAAIAAALAAGAAMTQGTVAGAAAPVGLTAEGLSRLTRLMLRWGYSRDTIRHALRVATRVVRVAGPAHSPVTGPATRSTDRRAYVFASWFLERTTARVDAAYAEGDDAGKAAEDREDRYLEQHLDAQDRRVDAAERVDSEAAKPGHVTAVDSPDEDGMGRRERVVLRWRAHPDDRTTPECAAADGAWFYADTPPIIGYPGMPHGGTCRCWSTHAGSAAEVARGRHVNDAVRAIISTETDHRPHPGASTTEDGRQTA